MKKELLKKIIIDYISIQKEILELFQSILLSTNPLIDFRQNKIKKNGEIGEYRYDFHGLGVFIEGTNIEFDIEFGDEGRFELFDAWRLISYIENFEKYRELNSEPILNELINSLRDEGFLEQIVSKSNSELYQLKCSN